MMIVSTTAVAIVGTVAFTVSGRAELDDPAAGSGRKPAPVLVDLTRRHQ